MPADVAVYYSSIHNHLCSHKMRAEIILIYHSISLKHDVTLIIKLATIINGLNRPTPAYL
jgi:hypothetical protein